MTFKFTGPGYYVTADRRKALVGAHAGELAGCVFGSVDGFHALIARIWKPCGASNFPTDTLIGPWVDPSAAPEPIVRWIGTDGRPGNDELFSTFERAQKFVANNPHYRIVRLTDQPDALAALSAKEGT